MYEEVRSLLSVAVDKAQMKQMLCSQNLCEKSLVLHMMCAIQECLQTKTQAM